VNRTGPLPLIDIDAADRPHNSPVTAQRSAVDQTGFAHSVHRSRLFFDHERRAEATNSETPRRTCVTPTRTPRGVCVSLEARGQAAQRRVHDHSAAASVRSRAQGLGSAGPTSWGPGGLTPGGGHAGRRRLDRRLLPVVRVRNEAEHRHAQGAPPPSGTRSPHLSPHGLDAPPVSEGGGSVHAATPICMVIRSLCPRLGGGRPLAGAGLGSSRTTLHCAQHRSANGFGSEEIGLASSGSSSVDRKAKALRGISSVPGPDHHQRDGV
jgi:hypothetical protein